MIDNNLTPYFDNWSSYKLVTLRIFEDSTQSTLLYQYDNSSIKENSFSLVDSICEEESINFIGCLAKALTVTIYDADEPSEFDLAGLYLTAQLEVEDDLSTMHKLPLFSGYIDSCKLTNTSGFYKIEAFDDLYKFIDVDMFSWYQTLDDWFTVKQFRDSLFTELGLPQVTCTLVNDDVQISKSYGKFVLPAIDCIKSICQVNGVFGKLKTTINALDSTKMDIAFDYVSVKSSTQQTIAVDRNIHKISLESFSTQRINTVNVYGTLSNVQYKYGNPGTATNKEEGEQENSYTIQGGILLKNIDSLDDRYLAILNTLATNLLSQVTQFPPYIPFQSENIGYPNAEPGDAVRFKYINKDGDEISVTTTILYRKLTNIQAMKDAYRSQGQRYLYNLTSSIAVETLAVTGTVTDDDDWIQAVEDGTNETFNDKVAEISQKTSSQVLASTETIIQSLSTAITTTALIPKIVQRGGDWDWEEGQEEGEPIRTFTRTNNHNYRNYLSIEEEEIKQIYQGLTPPANSSDIQDSETELLTFNGKQVYYQSLTNFNAGFTLISPKAINPQLSSYVEDMYKCRKLKNSSISEWVWNTFSEVTGTTIDGTVYLNFNTGLKFMTNAILSCVDSLTNHYFQMMLKNIDNEYNGIRFTDEGAVLFTNNFQSDVHPIILVTDLDDVPQDAPEHSIIGLYTDTNS